MSCCVLDCSRYCCYADRQVPLFQVDIRRNVHTLIVGRAALCLLDMWWLLSVLSSFVTANMAGWEGMCQRDRLVKGGLHPPRRVSKMCHGVLLLWPLSRMCSDQEKPTWVTRTSDLALIQNLVCCLHCKAFQLTKCWGITCFTQKPIKKMHCNKTSLKLVNENVDHKNSSFSTENEQHRSTLLTFIASQTLWKHCLDGIQSCFSHTNSI